MKNSRSELYEFLFHLRTPLASIRGAAQMAEHDERLGSPVPADVRIWIGKWGPKIDTWLEEVMALSALCGRSKPEDHDWKKLIQNLISSLEGVEVAAKEANDIPFSDKEESERDGSQTVCRMIINSIGYIHDHYRAMQELLPALS